MSIGEYREIILTFCYLALGRDESWLKKSESEYSEYVSTCRGKTLLHGDSMDMGIGLVCNARGDSVKYTHYTHFN